MAYHTALACYGKHAYRARFPSSVPCLTMTSASKRGPHARHMGLDVRQSARAWIRFGCRLSGATAEKCLAFERAHGTSSQMQDISVHYPAAASSRARRLFPKSLESFDAIANAIAARFVSSPCQKAPRFDRANLNVVSSMPIITCRSVSRADHMRISVRSLPDPHFTSSASCGFRPLFNLFPSLGRSTENHLLCAITWPVVHYFLFLSARPLGEGSLLISTSFAGGARFGGPA